MAMPTISVVVPVGSGEERLGRCLSSIAGQTFGDMEIVCVDDGASETDTAVCRQFAANDKRLRIVAPAERGGWAEAKNAGLVYARGKYIAFVNPSDRMKPSIAEKTLSMAERERADTVWVKWRHETDGGGATMRFFNRLPEGRLRLSPPELWRYPTASWNKLYRREFLLRNGLNWPAGLHCGDDEFFFKCFTVSDRAWLIDEFLYFSGSPANKTQSADATNENAGEALCEMGRNCRRFLEAHGQYVRHADALLDFVGQQIENFVASRRHKDRIVPAVQAMLRSLGHPCLCRGNVKRPLFDAVRVYRSVNSLPKFKMSIMNLRKFVPIPALRYWLTVFCLENENQDCDDAPDKPNLRGSPGPAGMAL